MMNISEQYVQKQLLEQSRAERYRNYFEKKLKKYGVESATKLSDEKKKKFYNEVDAGWESIEEEKGKEKKD